MKNTVLILRLQSREPTRSPLVLAALGPKMLDLCGREAQGTVTWMAGHKALKDHVVPRITAAAQAAGAPAPRVIAGVPMAVTNDRQNALEVAAQVFAIYGQLPAYRDMLDRGGAQAPVDVILTGDTGCHQRRGQAPGRYRRYRSVRFCLSRRRYGV